MDRLAINPDSAAVLTTVSMVELTAAHVIDTAHVTNSHSINRSVLAFQLSTLFCRLVDALNDGIVRFTLAACRRVEVSDCRIHPLFGRKDRRSIEDAIDRRSLFLEILEERLSYNLSQTREIMQKFGFVIPPELEAMIQVRNCIIHRKSESSVSLMNALTRCRGDFELAVFPREPSISPSQIAAAVREITAFIREADIHLHDTLGVPWVLVEPDSMEHIYRIRWSENETAADGHVS
jgi:hypothetical protein